MKLFSASKIAASQLFIQFPLSNTLTENTCFKCFDQ